MRSVFSAALWLQTLFIASNGIEASAKATQYSNIETRAQLYGSSHRVKRSVDTVQDIRNADNKAMTYGKLRADQALLQTDFNAIEKVLPAPLAINLLSQIVLIAAVAKDFAVICPTTGCKHLTYPSSFKTSLLQLSHSAYDAFNTAHVNMDKIERNMRSIPEEIRFSLITLLTGSDQEIEVILPGQLEELKRIAQVSRDSADETVVVFTVVKDILEEIIAGGKAMEMESGQQVIILDAQIDANKRRKAAWEEQKKELQERKSEIKEKLDQAEKKYEEALDNIPDGWSMMGMMVTESLANTFVKVISLIPDAIGGNKEQNGQTKQTDQNTENTKTSLDFPSCNLLPASGGTVRVTDRKQLEDNFVEILTNLRFTIDSLNKYVNNVFKQPSESKLSLVPNVGKLTATYKETLTPNKKQIENTGANSVPIGMKGPAVTFYTKIFDFMDEVVKKSKNLKISPEDVKKLYEQAQELSRNGECFQTWLNKLLDLPPITPKIPYNGNQDTQMTITQRHAEAAKLKVENWKSQMEEKENAFEKNSEKLLSVSSHLTEAIINLASFNATRATLQEQLEVLEDALEKLNQLKTYWLEIREFFQKISTIINSNVGDNMNRYIQQMENGRNVASLRHQQYFKNKIYAYIQEINTQSYLVRKMSKTYLNVSDEYILPPVRKLGLLLEADDKESKKLRTQIGSDTQKASRKMQMMLENQKREFLTSVSKRRQELEVIYKPIMDHIPEKRQRKIEKEVKETAAAVPEVLIEKRSEETVQIDGIEGKLDDFLDLE